MVDDSAVRNADEIDTVTAVITVTMHPCTCGPTKPTALLVMDIHVRRKCLAKVEARLHLNEDENTVIGIKRNDIDFVLAERNVCCKHPIPQSPEVRSYNALTIDADA